MLASKMPYAIFHSAYSISPIADTGLTEVLMKVPQREGANGRRW